MFQMDPPTSRNSTRMKEMFGMIFKLWWHKTLVDWAEKGYPLKAITFIPSFWGSKLTGHIMFLGPCSDVVTRIKLFCG